MGSQEPKSKAELLDNFTLTPVELVKRRHTLNVRETAYCLNVSMRTVWSWVAEGKLVALKDKPVRVRATDVARMMNDFDE
jgi:DNA-binding transcriptional regulator YiaG